MADEVEWLEGIVYGTGGGRDLKCDVYLPAGTGTGRPGLLLAHGGGWTGGSPVQMQGFARRLAADGFVCMAPEYRLLGESPWPAQIHDIKAAIRWFRANAASLGADPRAIAAQGSSAGAHLVLLAAGTPGNPVLAGTGGNAGVDESLAAVVAIFPPVLFYRGDTRPRGASPAASLISDSEGEEVVAAAGPLAYVGPSFPPTFLQHGTGDKVVPPSASMVMYEALVKARVPVEMHLYAEQPHGFTRGPGFEALVCAEIGHFLQRYLQPAVTPTTAAAVT